MSAMPHFTRAELEACRGRVVPDLIAPGLRLLFVGINPGLWTAATQTHFAHPGNRFYPALLRAGIIERLIDPAAGMSDADREYLIGRGVGTTNLVARASARADELTAAEYAAGGRELAARVARYAPHVVAVAGITAYRRAFGVRAATAGRQPEPLAGALLWGVPDPSGLDAHEAVLPDLPAHGAPVPHAPPELARGDSPQRRATIRPPSEHQLPSEKRSQRIPRGRAPRASTEDGVLIDFDDDDD